MKGRGDNMGRSKKRGGATRVNEARERYEGPWR